MLLISIDLALVSLYVVSIWFVQRKIRNFLPTTSITAKEKHTNEKPRNAQLRSRPRSRRIRRNLHDFIGKDDQHISDHGRHAGSDERCQHADPSLHAGRNLLRHRLVSQKILSK